MDTGTHGPLIVGVIAAGLMLALTPKDAGAAGFTWPDNTTKAVGRGGAYMLGVRGPEALYFNPALLTRLKGTQTTLDVNGMMLDVEFSRAGLNPTTVDDSGAGEGFGTTHNEFGGFPCCGIFPAPMFFASSDFGLEDFAFGLGAYGPSANGIRRFPVTPEMKYMLQSSDMLLIYYSAAIAYRIGGLRLGATLQYATLETEFQLRISTGLTASMVDDEDPANDTAATLHVTDGQPTGILGIAYDFSPSLSLGLSYTLPVDWEQEGTVDLVLGDNVSSLGMALDDDTATFKVSQADVLRAGLRYAYIARDQELFDVELSATYERWSRMSQFDIGLAGTLKNETGFVLPIEPILQAKDWQDTVSVRLGGDVAVLPWLTLRAGTYYESAAQKEEFTHPDFISWDRIGVGSGATFHVHDFDLDLGYVYTYLGERDVTHGAVPIEAPLTDEESPIVNNGLWAAHMQIFSLGLTYRYGAGDNLSTTPAITDL